MLEGKGRRMGFRFRRSFKLLPRIRINLSKSGLSTSIGEPGATFNISKRGTRGTVGIPGTGISYSEKLSTPTHDATSAGMSFGALPGWGIVTLSIVMLVFGLVTS